MMPRRFACGWKSRLPHKEHTMCRFELHPRSFSYRNSEKINDLPRQSLTNFITNTFVVYRVHLATRGEQYINKINYVSPFLRLLYRLDWISHSCTYSYRLVVCYNMLKLTSTFLAFLKCMGLQLYCSKWLFIFNIT